MRLTRRKVLGGAGAALAGLGIAAPALRAEDDAPDEGPERAEPIEIRAHPITHFSRSDPGAKRFGELEFRGGMVLTSSSRHFGGWSGLIVEPDGRGLLAISDVGMWLSANLEYDGNRPVRLSNSKLGPLLASGGRPLKNKREKDAEALALLDGTLARGTVLIGFERVHRIGRFEVRNRELGAPSGYLVLPREALGMRQNQGIEAVAVLQAGRLRGAVVAFAERYTRGSGYHTGWIWPRGGTGEAQRIQLRDFDGFNITDAAGLPDGSLLVLERYYRWLVGVKMRIRHLRTAEIVPGARLEGRVLIEADSTYDIDNMEGLAVHRGPQGETILSLISDDNFNRFLQRTVFLQFALGAE
jgi:hypothetical protein